MRYRKLDDKYIIRLERGEEVHTVLCGWAKENNLKGGFIQGIGALKDVKIGYYNLATKAYQEKTFERGMEVTSLNGNLSILNGERFFHIHVTLGDEDYALYGGHLISGIVSITMELVFAPFKEEIIRAMDEDEKFNLLQI